MAGPNDSPRLGLTGSVNRASGPFFGNIEQNGVLDQERISLEIVRRNHDLADVIGIVAHKAVAPVVERMAELAASGSGFKSGSIGLETKVTAPD